MQASCESSSFPANFFRSGCRIGSLAKRHKSSWRRLRAVDNDSVFDSVRFGGALKN